MNLANGEIKNSVCMTIRLVNLPMRCKTAKEHLCRSHTPSEQSSGPSISSSFATWMPNNTSTTLLLKSHTWCSCHMQCYPWPNRICCNFGFELVCADAGSYTPSNHVMDVFWHGLCHLASTCLFKIIPRFDTAHHSREKTHCRECKTSLANTESTAPKDCVGLRETARVSNHAPL